MERQQREKKFFDKQASKTGEIWWGSVTTAGKKRLLRRAKLIKEILRDISSPEVLEIGCGTGALTQYLLEVMPNLRLTCSDISPESLEIARKRHGGPGVVFETADICRLPYENETFGAVVGNSILHHLPVEKSLKECHRVLKAGGVMVLFEPNMLNPEIFLEKNVRFIGKLMQNTEDETAFYRWRAAAALSACGFRRISAAPFDFLHPATPGFLVELGEKMSGLLEKIPAVREIAGSLMLKGYK
jgi:ubiquinone/menaquinone biosynthesis C-methylase UbiE